MDKQNVTLSLPKALLKKAKLLAVEEETSFNELVRRCLEQRVGAASGYEKARKRQARVARKRALTWAQTEASL